MVKRPAEVIVAIGLIAVAVAMVASSFATDGGVNAASSDSPMRLPRILLGIWIALGLACAIRAALFPEPSGDMQLQPSRILPFVGLVAVMVLLLPMLGYLVSVTLGLAGLLWILGERNPLRGGLALLLLGPGLWFLFHHVLGLRLPVLLSGGLV